MTDDTLHQQLQKLWHYVTDQIKRQIVHQTLWIAMEQAKPITLEDDVLILGIDGPHFYLATNLDQLGNRTAIEKLLTTAGRRKVSFRIIQGETLADWEETREREKIAREMSSRERIVTPSISERTNLAAVKSWDAALSQVHRAYTALRVKSVPQARAQYVLDVIPFLVETEAQINPPDANLVDDRGLGHVLEKVAQIAETDSTTIALEFLRARSQRFTIPIVTESSDPAPMTTEPAGATPPEPEGAA